MPLSAARKQYVLFSIVGTALAACRPAPPAQIGYGAPWMTAELGRLVQQSLTVPGSGPAVEIPRMLLEPIPLPAGYAGEIAFATRMAALPRLAGMVGPQSSRATLLVARIYGDAGIPLISPTATSSRIKRLTPPVFQLAADERAEGEFIVRFVTERLRARRVTLYYLSGDEYGISLHDGVAAALRARRLVLADEVPVIIGSDFDRRVARSLSRVVPDAVIVAARGQELLAIATALHRKHPAVPVIGADGTGIVAVRAHGRRDRAVYTVAWWHPSRADTVSREFVARFTAALGHAPNEGDAMVYDALMVLAAAAHEAGGDRAALRRWLESLGTTRPAYRGVTGPIAFGSGRVENLLMLGSDGDSIAVVAQTGGW